MKKYILSITILALLAAGCGNQAVSQTQNTPPEPNITPSSTPPTLNPVSSVSISSLSPSSGPVNTQVTITGQGFTKTGNLIMFGSSTGRHHPDGTADNVVANANSSNGTTLSFAVPASGPSGILCDAQNHCIAIAAIIRGVGPYDVSVQNSNGTSNIKTFIITTTSQSHQPNILKLNPSSGPVGSNITINGSGFTATGNTISFGIGSFSGYSSADGKTLKFTVPSSLAPYCAPGTMCPQLIQEVTPGSYNVKVTNANGTSNIMAFTVTFTCPPNAMCATPNILTLSQLSPASGPVGTTVTITGTGFTPTGNKIKFGNLGSENNPSYSLNSTDGKTLVFNVPSSNYYTCQASTPPCYPPNYVTQPGTYAVVVINANGSSNSLNFTVSN